MIYGHLQDTTHEECAMLQPIHVPGGLYFIHNGQKKAPRGLYFSSDLREWWNNPEEYGGRLYTHFDNALRPVFGADGKQFEQPGIRAVCARYDEAARTIGGFYKE